LATPFLTVFWTENAEIKSKYQEPLNLPDLPGIVKVEVCFEWALVLASINGW